MLFRLAAPHAGKQTTERMLSSYGDQMPAKAADLPAKLEAIHLEAT